MIVQFAWFFLGLVLLVVGAEALVRGASRIALSFGVSPLVVGLTIVAFEQGHVSTQGHDAVVQRVAAVGTARAWPPLLQADAGTTA